MTLFRPSDEAETQQVIAWAAAERQALEIVGGGSKRRLGRPSHAEHRLELSSLNGIVDYDPAELVLTVRAATGLDEITAALDAHGQMLAFEPPDWGELLASEARQTIGGLLACNLSGPRRVRAGAARDHLLGFAAINGRAERWKAGGKVVKNVTGYDMCKLQSGAFGTLSALLEVSVRVLPRPETSCSVVVAEPSEEAALRALAAALNTPHEVSAAAYLPAAAARRSNDARIRDAGAVAILRLEGPAPSVAYRAASLERELGASLRLAAGESARLWHEIGAAGPLLGSNDRIVWRICPTPSKAAAIMHAMRTSFASAEGFYDWGGGLLWLAIDTAEAGDDAGAAIVRATVAQAGGHAMLLRAPDAVRERVPVFEAAPPALAAMTRRVKDSFDPNAVLNRGRMHEGV